MLSMYERSPAKLQRQPGVESFQTLLFLSLLRSCRMNMQERLCQRLSVLSDSLSATRISSDKCVCLFPFVKAFESCLCEMDPLTSSWPGSGWHTAHRGWSALPPRSPACWSLEPRCSPSSRDWRNLWSAQSDTKHLLEASQQCQDSLSLIS